MKRKLFAGLGVAVIAIAVVFAPGSGTFKAGAVDDTPVPATNTPVPAATNTPVPAATSTPVPAATATPVIVNVTSPVINFPQASCIGSGFSNFSSANVTFSWTPAAGASAQYLDLSLFDNNFQDGTYLSTPLPAGLNSFTWNGLLVGQAHYWRVSALTPIGWVSSFFGDFTPCAAPVLLPMTYQCTGFGLASVTFRWAPSSPAGLLTYVDLSLENNSFAPGTFIGGGPYPGTNQGLVWPGILANRLHYVRINTFNGAFWTPSQIGNFYAAC